MTTKHTPGPWFVDDSFGDDELLIAQHLGGPYLARVESHVGGEPLEASPANARLMAAAPALLTVLQKFVATMESLPKSDETSLRVWDVYRHALPVVAAAKGEQP